MGNVSSNDKETAALKEEVYQLKKILEETRRKNELDRTNERLAFERRLQTYLNNPLIGEGDKDLKSELSEQSDQFTKLLGENKKLQEEVDEKNKVI
jgi:hypothetical protein